MLSGRVIPNQGPDLNPDNTCAIIVGGALGIGRQVALDLSVQREVLIADRNEEAGLRLVRDIENSGGSASFYRLDVSSWPNTKQAIDQMIAGHGAVGALVYSAGITSRKTFDEVEWVEWQRTLAVNLTGIFHVVKALAPVMMNRSSGRIVIIGSGSAITGSGGGVHYAASKGGAFGLMRALAKELGPFGIRVNIVAPRVIESDMLNRLYPDPIDRDRLKQSIPIGKLGTMGDVSNMVQFLCSAESDYVHGQILLLDGGRTYSQWLLP